MSETSINPAWTVGTWAIDPEHSHIGFVVRHLMISNVVGSFSGVSGTITTAGRPEDSQVSAVLEAVSVNTANTMRDNHLRGGDFFDVANYPEWTFESTAVTVGPEQSQLEGQLTIRGITKPVTLTIQPPAFGPGNKPGSVKAGFSARGAVNRSDFGIAFNAPIPGGGVVLGERVQIVVEIEADRIDGQTTAD